MAEVIVGCSWSPTEPDIYWFGLSVDNGVTNEPVILTPASTVVVEFKSGAQWQAFTLAVAEYPPGSGTYAIRTTIPGPIANGQERTVRLTVDGVTYGPWVFRFYAP